jgi:hypothetical protein
MAGLRYVGGDLRLINHSRLQTARLLSAEPQLRGALTVSINPSLTHLPGLAGVTGVTTLNITNNPMLSECDALALAARLTPTIPTTVTDNLACP